MLKRITLSVTIVGVFLWGTFPYAGVDMHEVLWETTIKMEMP